MIHTTAFLLLALLLALRCGAVDAYERPTHEEIARRAIQPGLSSVDQVLTGDLGIASGIEQSFLGRTPVRLVGEGARDEDAPSLRVLNHFHDPLRPWENAGLDALAGLVRGQSAVRWQQNPAQHDRTGGGNWSWQDARRRYLAALTAVTRSERDREFADLFRTLGRLAHLVQDASVPAHTRNDPHVLHDGYEAWVEEMRRGGGAGDDGRRRRELFLALLNQEPVRPPLSLLTATGDAEAPVPIARLIDADRFDGSNAGVLAGALLGMAEYANGNFVSDDTIFIDYALPSPGSLGAPFVEPEGRGARTYYPKAGDGEPVAHFVADGVWSERLRFRGLPLRNDVLTDRVHQDYAAKLLPRAVGYSASLLDYFFRGRLDVDVLADPEDPARVTLTGSNRADEPLADGALALYAENADGVRRPVAPLGATGIADVAPAAALPAARFRLTDEAERLVVVYAGTLGLEARDGDRNFPGAVIGKVLGGVRVEEVFADAGGQWTMRSPTGVFALHDDAGPLTTERLADLRWGDGTDQLVASVAAVPGQLPRFAAYEIRRQTDSVAPVTQVVAGATAVRLVTLRPETAFPAALPALTDVTLDHEIDYRQQLVSSNRTVVRQWRPAAPETEGNDEINYQAVGVDYGPVTIHLANHQQVPFTDTFSVVLDAAHHQTSNVLDRPSYAWRVEDVGLTADAHIVAVVSVSLTTPPFSLQPRVSQPVYGYDAQGNVVVVQSCSFTAGCQPLDFRLIRSYPLEVDPLLWAVVDVTAGYVPAVTAEPALTIASREVVEIPRWATEAAGGAPVVYVHNFERREGGPRPSVRDVSKGWTEAPGRPWDGQARDDLDRAHARGGACARGQRLVPPRPGRGARRRRLPRPRARPERPHRQPAGVRRLRPGAAGPRRPASADAACSAHADDRARGPRAPRARRRAARAPGGRRGRRAGRGQRDRRVGCRRRPGARGPAATRRRRRNRTRSRGRDGQPRAGPLVRAGRGVRGLARRRGARARVRRPGRALTLSPARPAVPLQRGRPAILPARSPAPDDTAPRQAHHAEPESRVRRLPRDPAPVSRTVEPDRGRYQRSSVAPQEKPVPKAARRTRSPSLTRPACRASCSAMGTEAAAVLP
jgi:hypothetical protein